MWKVTNKIRQIFKNRNPSHHSKTASKKALLGTKQPVASFRLYPAEISNV